MAARKIKNKVRSQEGSSEVYLSVLSVLSDKKLIVLSILVAAFFCAFIFGIIYKRNYTASVYIYSKPGNEIASDLNRNAQDDHSIFLENGEIPIETYSAILRSPRIQMEILQAKYSVNFKYKHYDMDLLQYFSLNNVSYALQELNDITEINALDNSGVLKISVTTQYPDLSQQIAESYVNALEEYLEKRRQQKIEEKISLLDKADEAAPEHEQAEPGEGGGLTEKLEGQETPLMLARSSGKFRPGSIRSARITSNNGLLKSAVTAMSLAALLILIPSIVALNWRKSTGAIKMTGNGMRRVILGRGAELSPEKAAPQTAKKTATREGTQNKRIVKV
ncbi:MAG TPA: hypothetical protein ENO22_11360 [candidate division Zixibacteria bacterium]|nr:hypothetical protein [candidate division Zixibacteria bacterium]HEQ99924.1 hypothetical protein [candidate division Zixibacteria bacterium]